MIIHNPVITGSLQVNGSSVSSIEQLDSVSGSVAALNNATSSYALKNNISGSFTSLSSSLSTRLTDDEGSITSLNAATSSYLQNTTDTLTGNLTVTGTITAQEFHTEFVSASIIYESGSTQFGNSSDDTHTFTGTGSFDTVGIGNTSPVSPLTVGTYISTHHINSSTLPNTPGGHLINLTPPSTTNNYGGGISWSEGTNTAASINVVDAGGGGALHLVFATGNNTTLTERMRIGSSGLITIGDGSTSGTLQFENDIKTRKVVLYQGADNDNEFYGFGVENSTLVYSVYTASDDHVFFSGYSGGRNELMRIGGDGKVGIGSSSPASPLHINSTNTPQLIIQNVDGGANAERIGIELASNDIFRIKSLNDNNTVRTDNIITGNILTGKVGIGSGTPEEKLTIDGTSSGAYLRISNAASGDISSGIMIYNGSNLDTQIYTNPTFGNTTFLTREALAIRAGGSQRMIVLSNGNVGINSATPTARFQVVEGATDEITTFSISSAGQVEIARNHSTSPRILSTFGSGNAQLKFYKSGTLVTSLGNEATSYFGGGNLSIGTTGNSVGGQPGGTDGKLNVYTSAGSSAWAQQIRHDNSTGNGLFVRAGGNSSYYTAYLTGYDETNVHLVVRGDGRVGIGTNSPDAPLHVQGSTIAVGTGYNFEILANNDGNWGFQVQRTDGVDDYNTRMKFYPANGSTRKLGFWNASANEWMGYFDGSTSSYNRFIINGGDVGIGTTDPKTKLQVNGPIGMKNAAAGDPINARLVKAGSTSVTFTIKVGAVGAWRAGHAFLKVSGAQNGLQEHHSAWYHLKLVHYYLSGVTQSGTSNPALIKDSGGDTGSYTLSVTSTNTADPQEITITISDSGSTTNSMIADIDCSFYQGIKDIY